MTPNDRKEQNRGSRAVSSGSLLLFQRKREARAIIPYWKVAYPDVYLSAKRAADLKVQLDYAVETWTTEFITGSKSVEADYDAFLNEIQKLGEEYLVIYQAAYAK